MGSRRVSRQPGHAVFLIFLQILSSAVSIKVQLHELGFEAIALASPRRMKKGDGTEMCEVVHSTLMPSLLSDQILRLEGGTGQGERVTILKRVLMMQNNSVCQPELHLATYRNRLTSMEKKCESGSQNHWQENLPSDLKRLLHLCLSLWLST